MVTITLGIKSCKYIYICLSTSVSLVAMLCKIKGKQCFKKKIHRINYFEKVILKHSLLCQKSFVPVQNFFCL